MSNVQSYNALIDRFKAFASGHFILKTFSHGQIDTADLEKFTEYPFMHVVPSNVSYAKGTKTFSFQIVLADLPRDKDDKVEFQREVLSDLQRIAEDLIAEITNHRVLFGDLITVQNVSLEPFLEEFHNTLTGWTISLELLVPYYWDACSIPAEWNNYFETGTGGTGSILSFNDSIVQDGNGVVTLENDLLAPPANYYYGTNDEGVRGWYLFVDQVGLTCQTIGSCQTIIDIEAAIDLLQADMLLKANSADISAVGFSNDYNDLDNLPTIPTATSDLTNDSGFITIGDVPAQVNADWNATSGVAQILNKPTLTNGTVTAVTATSPIASTGGATPNLSMSSANGTTNGYLLSSDWLIFNGKFNTPAGTTLQYVRGDGSLATFPTIPSIAGLVPYTGATGNVDLGTNNLSANNFFDGFSSVVASGTQIVLTINSVPSYVVTGSGGQTFKMPNATTLPKGAVYYFNNNQSSGAILLNNNSNTLIKSIPSGGYMTLELLDNSTAAGSWDTHFQAPSNVSWSTNTFDYTGSITSATWNGVSIADNRIASSATWNAKQDALVSGTSIKTVNSTSLLGSGNVAVEPTITAGTTSQYWRGDKTWQTFPTIPTVGTWGALNYPTWVSGTPFVKMTAAGTFALDTNIYLTGITSSDVTTALGYTPVTNARTISTTAPLAGGGDLTANRTLSITQATTLVDGYLSATDWTTFNGKQAALVSGTNIKTINSTSLLGSGDIVISSSNIYNADGSLTAARTLTLNSFALTILGTTSSRFFANGNVGIGTTTDAGYKIDVNGTFRALTGSTIASFGINTGQITYGSTNTSITGFANQFFIINSAAAGYIQLQAQGTTGTVRFTAGSTSEIARFASTGSLLLNTITDIASSQLTVESTTKGFLPPRMTTTQKNAIASPAAGLVVFDVTLGKLCVFSTTWQTITSI